MQPLVDDEEEADPRARTRCDVPTCLSIAVTGATASLPATWFADAESVDGIDRQQAGSAATPPDGPCLGRRSPASADDRGHTSRDTAHAAGTASRRLRAKRVPP
ncbi:MAG: hypothetical protein MZV49_09410 [Rhodopseudomonas palustris]|nr:hypothetical protein [Rhodopseudomonas palustris]